MVRLDLGVKVNWVVKSVLINRYIPGSPAIVTQLMTVEFQ